MSVACKTCAYWSPPDTVTYRRGQETSLFGQCRRYPPSPQLTEYGRKTLFPMTAETWWCGEHAVEEGAA